MTLIARPLLVAASTAALLGLFTLGCGGGGGGIKGKAIEVGNLLCQVDQECLEDSDGLSVDDCQAEIEEGVNSGDFEEPADEEACGDCLDATRAAFEELLDSQCETFDNEAVSAACDIDGSDDSDGDGNPGNDLDACDPA